MLLDDIASSLESAGLGTVGTNLFLGSRPATAPVKCTTLYEYNGAAAVRTSPGVAVENPRLQVRTRDEGYQAARAQAEAIYKLLDGIANQAIAGTKYFWIEAQAPPALLQIDQSGNAEVVINFAVQKEISA